MRFKRLILLLLTSLSAAVLLVPAEGFLPYFFVENWKLSTDSSNTAVFDDDSSLVYVLQGATIRQLLKADFDVAVVDPDDSRLTGKNIASLQKQGKKIIAYLSIGEAEDYRSYWESDWRTGNPHYIDEENPDWDGNYKVRFWDSRWQDIVYKRLGELVKTGYDGVYLDVVDAYKYYQKKGFIFAKIEMINFVCSISDRSKTVKKSFLIIPQNGEELSMYCIFFKSIDGVGREDIWFHDDIMIDKASSDLSLKYLTRIKQSGKFVFAISYAETDTAKKQFLEFSKKYGFIPFLGNKELDSIEGF